MTSFNCPDFDTLADFSDEVVRDPVLVDLVSEVELIAYKGGPEAPFSEAELRQKFESCAVPMLGEARAGQASSP